MYYVYNIQIYISLIIMIIISTLFVGDGHVPETDAINQLQNLRSDFCLVCHVQVWYRFLLESMIEYTIYV